MTHFRQAAVLAFGVAGLGTMTALPALSAPRETGQTGDSKARGHKAEPDPRLAAALREWEAGQRARSEWRVRFTWATRHYDPFEHGLVKEVYRGKLFVKEPDRLRVQLRDAKDQPSSTILCVGADGHYYRFRDKREHVLPLLEDFRMPESAQRGVEKDRTLVGAIVESLTWPVLGPPLTRLEGRFALRLEKEDANWTYIRLEPMNIKQSWWLSDDEWQVVLSRKGRWLRRVWSRGFSTGEGVTVDFEEPEVGPLPARTWQPLFKRLPQGWQRLSPPETRE